MTPNHLPKIIRQKAVWVSSLGYFVDVYDLVIFGVVRVASLKGIGIPENDLMKAGTTLLNWQMAGMLIGGFAWGLLADRTSRMRALYGSIALYSLANFANAFAADLPSYALFRLIAGFGLAGELGAAVTLVSESVAVTARGMGAAVIGIAGFLGAVIAAILGGFVSWQTSYLVGGVLGFALLCVRIRTSEPEMFLKARSITKGAFHPLVALLRSPRRLQRYLQCILVGVPIWFVSGVLLYFSPELSKVLGIVGVVQAGQAILWGYVGSIIGDPISALLCQSLGSRKKGIFLFLILGAALMPCFFFLLKGAPVLFFYFFCFFLGIVNGYWTLFVAMTAEQFGTDVRATVTTTVPNLVRGSVIPMTALLFALKESMGMLVGAATIGVGCFLLALTALYFLPETFERDLNYLESEAT